MGFYAKVVFVLPGTKPADQPGPQGETECAVWKDSNWGLDFEHITRLEKLVGERFAHIHDSFDPFQRAGICAMDRFLYSCVFVDFSNQIENRCAPEILVPEPFFLEEEDGGLPTTKMGGRIYLDIHESRLKGVMGNERLVENHNRAAGNQESLQRLLKEGRWHPMMAPPLLWATCSELADCLDRSEADQDEAWKAIQHDPVSDAFVRGWREVLRKLGDVGARAVFRFS